MLSGHGDDIFNYGNIRINFSSNVYNHFCQDGLKNHLANCLDKISVYPEPEPVTLESVLSVELGINAEEVMVCNGATEAIYLIAQAFQGNTSAILEPTFSEYEDACKMHNHQIIYCSQPAEITHSVNLMWICNPNNPTGQVIPAPTLKNLIIQNPDTIFVIDSSYEAFTDKNIMSDKHFVEVPNVISLHSMTKSFAIPGLRLGYATANRRLISLLRSNRMPWSVNALAQEAGLYLLRYKSDYCLDIRSMMTERNRIAKAMEATKAIKPEPSDSHILLCRLERGTSAELKDYLARHHGILIRDASNFHGLTNQYFRIAIQTPEENDRLIHAIQLWINTL